MQQIISRSEQETNTIGQAIAQQLKKGDVVCLTGNLGTGKTMLSKAIAKGLGIRELVTSPTYTIVQEYEGDIPFFHFDVYRIDDINEMFEIGFEEYLLRDGVCLIEWADRISDILPEDCIWIHMYYGQKTEERVIKMNKPLFISKNQEVL
jgi:tRNA threonylcarbamoyladenosine biosynthesis protein TsaE